MDVIALNKFMNDLNGATPVPHAKRYIYAAGSERLVRLYQDRELTGTQPNPMVADSAGRFDLCHLMEGTYRIVLQDKKGVTLASAENLEVSAGNRGLGSFDFEDVAALIDDTMMSYVPKKGGLLVKPGRLVRADDNNYCYRVAPSTETRPHLTTTGGVKLYCMPTQSGEITVRQLGGIEGGDITVPLQHAIMVAAYGDGGAPIAGTVLIDVLEATLSDSVHLHYGYKLTGSPDFRGVRVRGLGRKYSTGTGHMGTRLTFTATDRPAFVLQRGRHMELGGFSLHGAARADLYALDYNGFDITQEATWDTALAAAGVTAGQQHAPYAGIAVDPYSGPEPAIPYPGWSLHGWISNNPDQYGQVGGSTETRIHDMDIEGFEVGVVQQPGDISANSDFLLMERVYFTYDKFGDSIGSSQARNTTRTHCQYNRVMAMVTNRRHGQQIGQATGSFNNCSGAGFIGALFDLNGLSYGGGLTFSELDVESLDRLGHIEAANTRESGILISNARINFRHDLYDVHPGHVVSGDSSGEIRFVGGSIEGYDSAISFANLRHVRFEGTLLLPGSGRTKAYERLAHNALAGGAVTYLLNPKPHEARFKVYNVSGGEVATVQLGHGFHHTGRDTCIPIAAGEATFQGGYLRGIALPRRPQEYNQRTVGTHFTVTSQVDRTITVDLSGQFFNEQRVLQQGYLPGDIVVHEPSGTVMFIRSTDDSGAGSNTYSGGTGAVVLELQNNYRATGGGYDPIDTSFLNAGAKWTFLVSRVYAPEIPVIATFGTVSADVSVLQIEGTVPADYGLAAGDYYWERSDPCKTFDATGSAVISSIDTATDTIAMGGAAAQDVSGHALTFWCRTPPANEAQR